MVCLIDMREKKKNEVVALWCASISEGEKKNGDHEGEVRLGYVD